MTRGGEMTLEQAIADWRDQIGKLRAERDAWRKLVVEHNVYALGPSPMHYLIDIPPELDQP